jgi:hypothetical protein
MPRLYAQNRTSMWADEDFRALTAEAQNLYNYLLAHPTTTYAGVADWFPKRLAHVNSTWTAARVDELGRELAAKHFVVIDEDWDEVCIRSFLRWESVLKAPNLARAAAHAFERIESPRLQRVVIHELLRLREEEEDWPAWKLDEFDDILTRRPPLDGKSIDAPINTSGEGSDNPSPDPGSDPSGKGSVNPSTKGSEVTSNQYLVPSTPKPVTLNLEPSTVAASVADDDEFSARATLKALDLDYSEVRKAIERACDRTPAAGVILEVAQTILGRADGPVRHPLAFVVESIKRDWAVWQQLCDKADAA